MSEVFNLCDVAANNGKNGKPLWLIIKGTVYDLTKFSKQHPGGEDLLLEYGGKDATQAFNEVGHSTDAIKELKLYKIGTISNECSQFVANQAKRTTDVEDLQLSIEPQQCCRKQKKRFKLFFCF